jgi:hypothetical protein
MYVCAYAFMYARMYICASMHICMNVCIYECNLCVENIILSTLFCLLFFFIRKKSLVGLHLYVCVHIKKKMHAPNRMRALRAYAAQAYTHTHTHTHTYNPVTECTDSPGSA